jgi:hypothetical protein
MSLNKQCVPARRFSQASPSALIVETFPVRSERGHTTEQHTLYPCARMLWRKGRQVNESRGVGGASRCLFNCSPTLHAAADPTILDGSPELAVP